MRFFPKNLPEALWKRILIRCFFLGLYGFIGLVLFIVGVITLFQIPGVTDWIISSLLKSGWSVFPDVKPPALTRGIPSGQQITHDPQPSNAFELFQWDKVWNAHFKFTSNQWVMLSPKDIPPLKGGLSPKKNLRNPVASRSGLLGVIGWDLDWSHAESLDFNGTKFTNVAARYKGNGTFLESKNNYKRSLKADLNEHVKGQRLAKQETLNFHNLLADRSRVSDTMGYRYFKQIGVPSPGTSFVEVSLEIGGIFPPSQLGLYLLVQKPNGPWLDKNFGKKGGALLKPVTLDLLKFLGEDWVAYEAIYGSKTKLSDVQQKHIMDAARWMTNLSGSASPEAFQRYFDVGNLTRFFAGQVLLSNFDGILFNGQNFLMTLAPETNLIGFAPWDLDHSWGEFPLTGTLKQRIHASIHKPWIGKNFFVEKLFAIPSFKERYLQAIQDQLDKHFIPEQLNADIDHIASIIRPFVQKEPAPRPGKFEIAVNAKFVPQQDSDNPMDPNRPAHQIKRFINDRHESVRAQLAGEEEGVVITFDQ